MKDEESDSFDYCLLRNSGMKYQLYRKTVTAKELTISALTDDKEIIINGQL
jgi:hypothetical protein